MTPPSAPDAATDRQTVGDILLARGYISEDQLEQAIASQQRSGKPLGQEDDPVGHRWREF